MTGGTGPSNRRFVSRSKRGAGEGVPVFADVLLEPLAWARRHFGDLDLGDRRRNDRAVKIAAAVAASPGASLPRQRGDAHQAKAAYRVLDTPDRVTFESLAGGHWAATRAGIGSEEYHKCLKTDCGVEARQLETAGRLEALLGFPVVVAVRPLAIKQQADAQPDAPATTAVGELAVNVPAARRKLKAVPGRPDRPPILAGGRRAGRIPGPPLRLRSG